MKLKRLEIRRLPGIDQPFTVDFEPSAVNVITGPNASGKSSLVRAVRALLYPDDPQFLDLNASWETSAGELFCERHGRQVNWLSEGKPSAGPALPSRESSGAFLISSEDLTALGSTDAHISSRLRTMLAGGYDLDAVLTDAPLQVRPRPQKLARALTDATARLADKENEQARLDEEVAQIGALKTKLEQTRDASARQRACEDALALAEAYARRKALENTLIEEFPGGMDRLRGDEAERLQRIEQAAAEREKELAIEQGALRQARERLERTGAIRPEDLEALQSELDDQRDALTELERQIEAQQDRIAEHDKALVLAARRLGSDEPEPAQALDQEALENLEKLVDRVQTLREKIRNLTGELARAHASRSVTGRPVETLRRARQALQRWLDGARLSPLEGVLWAGLAGSAALAGWRLLGPQSVPASPELILLILLAAGIPAGLLASFLNRWRDLGRAQQDFLDTEVEPPLGWAEEEVEARLERLDLELESANRHEISQARAAEVRDQLNNQRAALDKAREKLQTFAQELGVSAENRLETGFQLWCRHLHDWQREQNQRIKAQTLLEQFQHRYIAAQARAQEMLKRHGMAEEGEISSRVIAGLIHQLAPRMRRNTELHNNIRAHQRRIDELNSDIAQQQAGLERLFDETGVRASDKDALLHRIDRFESWQSMEQQRRDLSLEVTRLEERLAGEKHLLDQARTQQREALETLHESLAEQLEQRDRLNRRIAELQTRHEEVLSRRELEALFDEQERHRRELDQELDRHLLAAAGESLIEDIRSAHQSSNEPEALALAGRWFDRFTRHRYRLEFSRGEFFALDGRNGRRRALAELSTGTRVQLLLAVRLAWIERAETDSEALPVFLDEVLTTTDPDRYRAIVQSVQEIVVGGRQVFYLTAQTDDARAWTEWAEQGPTPHRVDMAEVRGRQVVPLQFEMPRSLDSSRDIPDPSGRDALEWADEAGVDAIDPWQDAGAMHVFHLLHDQVELSARLMKMDLARLGDLEAFLASGQAEAKLDSDTCNQLSRRIQAARLILKDWQQRRDRPVDQAVLNETDLISDNFMARVSELAEKVGRHPRKLINGLTEGEVSRFRSDTIEQLEHWLVEAGYLNEESGQARMSATEISIATDIPTDRVTDLRAWINGAIIDPLAKS